MGYKKIFILTFLIISFFLCKAQAKKFPLDTLVDQYLLKIRVYETRLDENNIKASFAFYDSTQKGKLRFVYYFKFLPPKDDTGQKKYIPIFQDWDDYNNSRHLWRDIKTGEIDYDNIKNYVFEKVKNIPGRFRDTISKDTVGLKANAKNEFLKAFNGLINKDYLTFAKSLHPLELNKISYKLKANYLKEVYKSTPFQFVSVKIDSIGKFVNFFGEIQIMLFSTATYEVNGKKEVLKQFVIARSFDNGLNWYFSEVMRNNYNSYKDMSKGNLNKPAISWELLNSLKF